MRRATLAVVLALAVGFAGGTQAPRLSETPLDRQQAKTAQLNAETKARAVAVAAAAERRKTQAHHACLNNAGCTP